MSSMHRAKGLEYDRVFLLEDTVPEDSDEMEHARLLYMAMTRCRDDFYRLDPLPRSKVYVKTCRHSGRWGRYQFQFAGRRLGLALSGDDVSSDRPAGTEGFMADPLELQEYLIHEVKPGDPVVLTVLDHMPDDGLAVPAYTVNHGGRPIGVVSHSFRMDLARYMYRSPARLPDEASWPSAMTNCWIDDVEAVAGGEAQGRRVGLGEHGVWLAPRLTGLSSFRYHRNDTEHDDE
ncbi:ATP-binding domain-containing protein [Catellatospora coxensis]